LGTISRLIERRVGLKDDPFPILGGGGALYAGGRKKEGGGRKRKGGGRVHQNVF
jgi:hypothetical protein